MKWLNILRDRLKALRQRDSVIDDIDREMRTHLDLQTEANIRAGMSPREAHEQARRSFGNLNRAVDAAYDVKGGGVFETLAQDVRYGARMLLKHKAFTLVAVITLALGIGANSAIFSVVNELLLRPLPYSDPDRIVMLWEVSPEGRHQNTTSRANFRAWRDQSTSYEHMAAFSDQRLTLTGNFEPEEVSGQLAIPDMFKVLGVDPILGRTLLPEDGNDSSPLVAVLSYGLWQRRFGGQSSAIGQPIVLNGLKFEIVGVMPPNFQFHIKQRSGTGRPAEVWITLPMPTGNTENERGRFLSTVAKLKPGVTPEQAGAELRTIEARLSDEVPQFNKNFSAEVLPLREQFFGNVRRPLWLMLGAVGFVLLIACANVANLLLSLATAREKEIALRAALGARRSRIVRQLLTESLLLALLGSALGLGFAWLGIKALLMISPRDVVSLQGVGVNLSVLLWTLGVSVLTGIIFGLAPALHISRLNLNESLKEGGKADSGQATGSRRIRSVLVVSEIALAVVLLASAGLLVRSFIRLQQVDRGFNPDNVLSMVVRLPSARYPQDPQLIQFFNQAMDRLRNLPGVRSAGMINFLPLYGGLGSNTGFKIIGRPEPPPGQGPSCDVRVVDAGYFQTLGIPLLRGRNFSDSEQREAKRVVLINEAFARKHFPNEDPIGQRVDVAMFEQPTITEIIGVVGNVRYDSLIDEAPPAVYFPHPELAYPFMTLVLRTDGEPAAIAPAVQREIRAIDPNQPVSDVRTMDQVMAEAVSRSRFNTLLLGLFAALATLLSAVGIFGVMNYSVALRTREIGLRLAIGAQPRQVLLLVLKQGLTLTIAGVGLGLLAAFALTRLLTGLLFGVEAVDATTFTTISLLLVMVSLLACYLPARRAMRIDPMMALRYE
ncbi:MAG TPA: ABC transporter permease [Pyrinomonadaceae bacterium]|jgi:putative ABC transport system permease protein|nr:ABC transporter permease [Pyrinomonadaceae bacterium]